MSGGGKTSVDSAVRMGARAWREGLGQSLPQTLLRARSERAASPPAYGVARPCLLHTEPQVASRVRRLIEPSRKELAELQLLSHRDLRDPLLAAARALLTGPTLEDSLTTQI
jgi:hypothetical protein